MPLIDTHCHLDFKAYDHDRAAVVERARRAGVTRIINPGTDYATSQAALKLSQTFEGVFAAVGVHPNATAAWSPEMLHAIETLATNKKEVIAIGEIGLDYHWDKSPPATQRVAFEAQLALATRLELPVIIHNREASQDVLDVLAAWAPTAPDSLQGRLGVLHSFSAPLWAAEKAIELGFYLGFTGPLTFKNADELRAVAARMPLDRLLVETDGPYLTPAPHRGQRNEPAYVIHVAQRLAALHQVEDAALATQTTANAEQLFKLPATHSAQADHRSQP